jgi:hypothetical protein
VPRIDSSMVDADAEGLSDTKLPAAMRARHGRTDHHLPDLSTPRLSGGFANLRVVKLIDEGASSTVWEGEWAGARVVIKVLREAENMTTPALTSFQEEVGAPLRLASHRIRTAFAPRHALPLGPARSV